MPHVIRFIGVVALLGVLAGCGGRGNPNAPATISGRVTYNGAPVTGGNLLFHGADSVYPASIADDGTYFGRDFPVGEMVVTVDTEINNPKRQAKQYPGSGGRKIEQQKPPEGVTAAPAAYVKIPPKYADKAKSDLKVTITPGKQVKDLELKD